MTQDKQHFAELAVDSVLRLKGVTNLSYIQVTKKLGGSIKESFLCEGLILEKTISTGCKRSIKNCKVLASNTPMDYDKVKIYGTRVRVESLEKVQEVSEAEKMKMKEKVVNHTMCFMATICDFDEAHERSHLDDMFYVLH